MVVLRRSLALAVVCLTLVLCVFSAWNKVEAFCASDCDETCSNMGSYADCPNGTCEVRFWCSNCGCTPRKIFSGLPKCVCNTPVEVEEPENP